MFAIETKDLTKVYTRAYSVEREFLPLVENSVGYLLYKWMDRIARDKGLLCHY